MTPRTRVLRLWAVSCLITVVVVLPVRASGQVPVEPDGSPNAEEDGVAAEQANRSPQEALLPTVLATALEGTVDLDGVLDEEAWAGATVATSFVAQQPTEGALPGEPTEVHVLFDEEALYVGARLFESDPSNIRGQLVRRDQEGQFDYFEVLLDSNLDRRTGFMFQVSARGVQSDILLFDDTNEDRTWDAVWESEVSRDDQGWSVEMRIPLSQLRYEPSAQPQTWGVNFTRRRVVSNELLQFALVSRLQQGLVSQSGRVTGLVITEPPGGVDVFFAFADTADRAELLALMHEFRRTWVCETDYARRSLKGQMTQASRLEARIVVVRETDQIVVRERGREDVAVEDVGELATRLEERLQ